MSMVYFFNMLNIKHLQCQTRALGIILTFAPFMVLLVTEVKCDLILYKALCYWHKKYTKNKISIHLEVSQTSCRRERITLGSREKSSCSNSLFSTLLKLIKRIISS